MPHHERDDYEDELGQSISLIERLFLGIEPIHFVLLAFIPCWWPLAPGSLGWAALGLLVGRHPVARRNALILLAIALGQLAVIGAYVILATRVRLQ
jgi:hypothetical protein